MILDDGLSVGLDCNIALLHDYAIKHFFMIAHYVYTLLNPNAAHLS